MIAEPSRRPLAGDRALILKKAFGWPIPAGFVRGWPALSRMADHRSAKVNFVRVQPFDAKIVASDGKTKSGSLTAVRDNVCAAYRVPVRDRVRDDKLKKGTVRKRRRREKKELARAISLAICTRNS